MQRWSGRESRLLREAMRMSLRRFAAHLGMSDRAVSNWESGGATCHPSTESQAVLDTALARASDEVKARFAEALGVHGEALPVAAGIGVDSHKFLPVFIGVERARRLRAHMTTSSKVTTGSAEEWLESSAARVAHPETPNCTLHVFACGVAVFHIVQPHEPACLTELAVWRYRSYASDLPWARERIRELLDEDPARAPNPEYVLSLYWLTSSPWTGSEYDTALRLLSTPSVLVDRGAPGGAAPLDGSVEALLLATGFDHPDIVSFGVRGVSTGYAGWSGVAYASIARERSLTVDELVACELTVQALWCFTRQVQQMIEDGQDPSMPERYGWRFLRAAYSRLTTARAQETAQHVLMREAIMKTSGLAERLRAAQDALREGVG
ncbi:helix-turn-helix transcriptional regulator [Streptomyces sp. HNM0663]|uniref:Helix-turn-helix transcriptional regulator n=1 Tax=Streptomyces chengmaiensis TaxID=3040919 RepID=A0ABT6HQ70_9ACTN|nr:helix-turn-helix transcriptional regulator [Streptomyces chengmaiensis]MDH2390867.1 helix-turn-helix transcriptional regulator [Streptomyces chengmaiensis]